MPNEGRRRRVADRVHGPLADELIEADPRSERLHEPGVRPRPFFPGKTPDVRHHAPQPAETGANREAQETYYREGYFQAGYSDTQVPAEARDAFERGRSDAVRFQAYGTSLPGVRPWQEAPRADYYRRAFGQRVGQLVSRLLRSSDLEDRVTSSQQIAPVIAEIVSRILDDEESLGVAGVEEILRDHLAA
jgi:hypothetical protein